MSSRSNDLSAAHQILKLVERSKAQSESIIDRLSGISVIFDDHGTILRANETLAKVMGEDLSTAHGRNIKGLFTAGDWSLFSAQLQSLSEKNLEWAEFELPCSGESAAPGIYFWRICFVTAPNRYGTKLFSASATDVTRLRENERKLSDLFRSAPFGILTVNSSGLIEQQYSQFTNRLLERTDLIGSDFVESVFQSARTKLSAAEATAIAKFKECFGVDELRFELMRSKLPLQIEISVSSSKLSKFVGLKYQAISIDRAVEKILVILEDRSALVRAERERQRQQQEDEANIVRILQIKRLSAEVLPIISHELAGCAEKLKQIEEPAHDVAKLMRLLHGMKGNARICGFTILTDLTHALESYVRGSETPAADQTASSLKAILAEWSSLQSLISALNPDIFAKKEVPKTASPLAILVQEYNALMSQPRSLERDLRMELLALEMSCQNFESFRSIVPLLEERFAKTVAQAKRRAKLVIHGADTLITPDLRDQVSEILMHMINNSVAHGIEESSIRSAAGKPPEGLIAIRFEQKADTLTLAISDDGSGIDIEKIRHIGIRRKFISIQQSLSMTKEELMRLILLPGFSTTTNADQISGRGVGLDAVSQRLRECGGRIDIHSQPGSGAQFVISIPAPRISLQKRLFPLHSLIEDFGRSVRSLTPFAGPFVAAEGSSEAHGLVFGDNYKLILSISTIVGHFWRDLKPSGSGRVVINITPNGSCSLDFQSGQLSPARHRSEESNPLLQLCAEILEAHGGSYAETKQGCEIRLGQVLLSSVLPEVHIVVEAGTELDQAELVRDKVERFLSQCKISIANSESPDALRIGQSAEDIKLDASIDEIKDRTLLHLERLLDLRPKPTTS